MLTNRSPQAAAAIAAALLVGCSGTQAGHSALLPGSGAFYGSATSIIKSYGLPKKAKGGVWVSYYDTNQSASSLDFVPWPYSRVTKSLKASALTRGGPVAVSANGSVAVANAAGCCYSNPVLIFSAATGSLRATLNWSQNEAPTALAFDSGNNLFVLDAEGSGNSNILKFPYPYNGSSQPVASVPQCNGWRCSMLVDRHNNIVVTDTNSNTVYVFAASSYSNVEKIKVQVQSPVSLALDAAGNLFVGNKTGNSYIAEYKATGGSTPYSGSPAALFQISSLNAGQSDVDAIAVDKSEDVLSLGYGGNTVADFQKGAAGLRQAKPIQYGLYDTVSMVVDSAQNLIVANSYDSVLDFYGNPYPLDPNAGSWSALLLGTGGYVEGLAYAP